MGQIQKIVNDINDKIYVGKTEFPIEKRFKEHCSDRNKRNFEKRPLYDAMNKYGIEHFHIELIEETDNLEEREIYWINYYNSYHNGYNATIGGDGKKYLDYELIKNTQLELKNVKATSEKLQIDRSHTIKILTAVGITHEERKNNGHKTQELKVAQYDLKGNYIQTFNSITEAGYAVWNGTSNFKGMKSHISAVCKGKRQTACGYKWKYVEE